MIWLEKCAEAGKLLFSEGGPLQSGTGHIPSWYLNEPVLSDWYEAQVILGAFFDLNTCRQFGAMGGILAIPWTAVRQYSESMGLDMETARWFWSIIRDLDGRYVTHFNKTHAPQPGSSDAPTRERAPLGRTR